MNSIIQLIKRIFTMKFPWNLLVSIMAALNMLGGLYYWSLVEGKVILCCLIGSFIVMAVIFTKYGFVRLLGAGHILFWTPLIIWLFLRILEERFVAASQFKTWIYSILIINSLSLVIDYLDVIRYFRGDKAQI